MSGVGKMDGATAVWNRDVEALQDALDHGWGLPRARLRSGHAEDATLILRVIATGWVEGWRAWAKKRPDFSSDPILLESILSQAQAGILQEIIRENGGSLPWKRTEDDLGPQHLLFQLIGSQMGQMGKLVPDEQVVECARLLDMAGVNSQAPYPGSFEASDLSPPGHTLWSWAILWGYFDLAEALQLGDEVFDMPKANQSLMKWFERAWVPSWASSDSFDGGRGRITWLRWMTPARFSKWLETEHRLNDIELHASIQSLPSDYQSIAWSQWIKKNDQGWSVLHDLASSLLPPASIEATLSAIKVTISEQDWTEGWEGVDEYGMSPRMIWEEKQSAHS